jgi:hypothetical protein
MIIQNGLTVKYTADSNEVIEIFCYQQCEY